MSRTGPVTKDTSTVALGLAEILVGPSGTATYTNVVTYLTTSVNGLGALNSTSFTSEVEFWKLESGFPLLEDKVIPLRESAKLECEFKEINVRNLKLARGMDHAAAGAGSDIPLGTAAEPKDVRMEAIYTYPNKTNKMSIIFPRAQVTSSVNLNFAAEDNMNVSITFEAKAVDHASWTASPLGKIIFS